MNNENLEFIQLAKQIIPTPYESRPLASDVMVRFGQDNLYPNFLLNLYANCPIHHAIIDTKAAYIIGDGLRLKGGGELNIVPNQTESMDEFVDKIVKDYLIHNAYSVEVQYNELTYKEKALAYNHIPVHCLRMNKEKTKFWYSDNWIYKKLEWTYERWQVQNPDPTSKVFWNDGYIPSVNRVYVEPDYTACIESIVTDMSIRLFNRNNITSNFSPSKLITYFLGENVPKNIQDDIKRKLDKYFSGAGEKYMLVFANPGQEKIKVDNIDANTWDAAYQVVSASNKEDIYEGHSINSALLGKSTAGKLGNTQELELSYEIFKSNYVQSKRAQLESSLSKLFGQEVEFIDRPLFKGRLSDTTKEKVYTINELRSLENLPPLPDGDKLLNIQAPAQTPTAPVQQTMEEDFGVVKLTYEDFDKVKHLGCSKETYQLILDSDEGKFAQLQVMYDYVERPGLPPLQGEHRSFCDAMLASNKYYTRTDIQQMSTIFGYDVYRFGGLFYRWPAPSKRIDIQCRHQFVPVIVTKR